MGYKIPRKPKVKPVWNKEKYPKQRMLEIPEALYIKLKKKYPEEFL